MDELTETKIGAARVLWRGENGYEEARRDAVWNAKKPQRFPDVIVTALSEDDVVDAITFARAHELKVAIRGGGHSMCGASVRDGGMLLDLSELKAFDIDVEARTAWVQPGVTSGVLARALAEHNLAFPVGHHGSVPMSGYLLAGGLGWNMGTWGPACFSVLAVEVVTAAGERVFADPNENADLYWAARGAGPGFFGVATRFHVRLYPLPRAITVSMYLYPFSEVEAVARWATEAASSVAPSVEMQLRLASAPPGVPAGPGGKAIAVLGVAFEDSEEDAARSLSILETCPALDRALVRQQNVPASFEMLHRSLNEALPQGLRYIEDTAWSNAGLDELLPRLAERLVGAPSAHSFVLAAGLPPQPEEAKLPDAAFSMVARTFLLMYGIWEDEGADAANEDWFHDLVGSVEPYAVGHYIAEAELPESDGRARNSFAPDAWQRIQTLKKAFDPSGLFQTFLGNE